MIALPPLALAGVLILAYGVVRRRPLVALAGAAAIWAGFSREPRKPSGDA